jgi:hypothetical protein
LKKYPLTAGIYYNADHMLSPLFFFFVFVRAHVRVLAFILLAAVIIGVYWPSLYHIPRADQIGYLAEVSARQGFASIVLDTLDLNRTRSFMPGDQLLFEPLLFLLLGLETFFFRYNMILWQAMGIGAHIFAAGALYALLCRIRGGVFALAATAFFAFLPTNIEAVTWQHITAYVFFAGFMFMCLRNVYAAEMDRARASDYVPAALMWMAAGMLIYITGVWYAIVSGLLFWRRGLRGAACGFWSLVAGWGLLNGMDLAWRSCPGDVSFFVSSGGFWVTLKNMAFLAKWCLSLVFFLSPADMFPISRIMIKQPVLDGAWPVGAPLNVTMLMGIALLVLGALCYLAGHDRREQWRRHAGMIAACLAMAAGYLFVITAGRLNTQDIDQVLRYSSYYPYNFFPFFIVLSALVWPREVPSRAGKWLRYGALVLLSAVIILNAGTVRRVNAQMARDHAGIRAFLVMLDRFVAAHEKEPDFSFYAAPEFPGNYTADWLFQKSDPPGRKYTVAEAMYRRYYTADHPKYIIR